MSTWVKEVWAAVRMDMVKICFRVCGLRLNLDGSEDHEWCEHTLSKDYRNLLTEQRAAWEKAHGNMLSPLQLLVVPDKVSTSNPITDAANQVAHKMLKNPTGGYESIDDGDSDSDSDCDIEGHDMVDLVGEDDEEDIT